MTKRFYICLSLIIMINNIGLCWNKVGHDASAYIAECHLTPQAKATIERYLDGHSIVYYASWLDLVRLTPAYKHTYKWHGFTATPECKYMERPSGNSDAVKALNQIYADLQDYKNMSDSAVATEIKMLIHIVPDMHCPAHVSFSDYPQGEFTFKLREEEFLFHSYWDGAPDLCHKWYYTDYQYQLDRCSDAEFNEIVKGTPLEWAEENARRCRVIYTWVKDKGEYDRAATYELQLRTCALVDYQLVVGGYRLAEMLNSLFDK